MNISDLSGDISLFRSGNYVFCYGKQLSVFTISGEHLFTSKEIRVPHQTLALPSGLFFVEACGWYYLLELPEGNILWKEKCPNGWNVWKHMRLSPDGKKVYQRSTNVARTSSTRLTVTDLEKGTVTQTKTIQRGLSLVQDYFFDAAGDLCFLQTEVEDGVRWIGIAYQDGWKIEPWACDIARPERFWKDADTLLTKQYGLYHIPTGKFTDFSANEQGESCPVPRAEILSTTESSERFLMDFRQNGTIVFDMQAGRRVAQYAEPAFGGIIVGDEYWYVSPKNGGHFVRKPFPAFEELSPIRLTTLGIIPPRDKW